MSSSFAVALNEAKGTIKLTEIAREMVGPKEARSLVGNLSKFQHGHRIPSETKVKEIARALGSIQKLPPAKVKQMRDRLMEAAGHADARFVDLGMAAKLELSETAERKRLRKKCHRALQTVQELEEHQIEIILDHVGVSTMKLIIEANERGEEIEVVHLQKISSAFQKSAAPASGTVVGSKSKKAETVVKAGRARILIDGDVSPAQMKVLQSAAQMINSVLKL